MHIAQQITTEIFAQGSWRHYLVAIFLWHITGITLPNHDDSWVAQQQTTSTMNLTNAC